MLTQVLGRNPEGIKTSSRCVHQRLKNFVASAVRRRRHSSCFLSEKTAWVPKEKVDCVVIGAGVVGLTVARALALKGREVLVLESAPTFGTGTSSRNSEVIHAGIYYPRNSLKAIFCEVPMLNNLMKFGIQNGVDGLRMMEGLEAMRREPELQCVKALFSPLSGIVDSHSLMLSLVGEAENHRTTFSYNSTVKFGPDVEWIDGVDDISSFLNKFEYSVSPNRAKQFYPEIRKYYPNLKDGSLKPGYAGIRPKLSGPHQPPVDFLIQGEDTHGMPGLVNLLGIESPGLTSSLAIAEYISTKFLS
ncbi:L-2-hydroxyglutarate dehydrogenase, mitochondrial [Quillaja saponaria]|uniref:L-2-hydroxyglutarate dehydrogenase, mitochondrial n=1 Tax=Quillaja saponaria TaxID=32244 RepID=A0AAD7Q808_QUISA|nr:L-2-hydroxyglutarate dehydrogenase, mitochondrial [Quillaja saponaria]